MVLYSYSFWVLSFRLFETLQSLFWSIFGLINLYVTNVQPKHEFTEFVGATMFGTYNVISLVVLLNMLIAMMNNSYQLIAVSWSFVIYTFSLFLNPIFFSVRKSFLKTEYRVCSNYFALFCKDTEIRPQLGWSRGEFPQNSERGRGGPTAEASLRLEKGVLKLLASDKGFSTAPAALCRTSVLNKTQT